MLLILIVKDVNTKDDIIFCYAASNFPKGRMIIFCCSKIICIQSYESKLEHRARFYLEILIVEN